MNQRLAERRLLQVLLLSLACLACTAGTFTCESGDDDGDKVVVKGSSK
jgi:hypothetical protein